MNRFVPKNANRFPGTVLERKKKRKNMNIVPLDESGQLDLIKEAKGYTIIFKHNTTCPISKSTKSGFEKDAELFPEDTTTYLLDILNHRDLSDAIAKDFDIVHESPQLLLIKDGVCTFQQSLYDISASEVVSHMQ